MTRFLTRTNTTSLTAAQILILENKYYEQIVGRIITETSGADWQFGDRNYTAFPTFTLTLVNATAAYDLNAPTTAPLTVYGVEVLTNGGIWYPLKRTSYRKIREAGYAQPEYYKTAGQPLEYEIRDSQIVLYPAPDNGVTVTLTNGLRIYYLRTADVFTSAQVTTGTKVPGFPIPWHDLMSYGPAYDYALANGLSTANHFKAEYDRRMKEMLAFISKRDQDTRTIMTPKRTQYI
ncbi:MAG: hypothetical protein Q6360_13095 [Candidatus Brocadiales bacterium]|nr:hypothetical protein [Candidatus Brocadiales bacterium]